MRIGSSRMVAPRTGLPPSRNRPRIDAHGRSRSVPASCWPAGISARAKPASACATTRNGSPGSGNAKRPAASVNAWWLLLNPCEGSWASLRRRRQQNLRLRHGLASGVEDYSGDRLARLEAEILRAGRVVANAELRPILRAITRRLDAQPQRNVGAVRAIIQPAVLARHGVVDVLQRASPCGTHRVG